MSVRSSWAVGSSPHTRGAPQCSSSSLLVFRIIPAYAGSTSVLIFFPSCLSDHPRIRGEHDPEAPFAMIDAGSSPHTRGAQHNQTPYRRRNGIIPAYAGSTCATRSSTHNRKDHPRIRGEHYAAHKVALEAGGSSPHTRGAPQLIDLGVVRAGIIPAYAGSTPRDRAPHGHTPDHPRIRGEHARTVRGHADPPGIIPAYAGSTCPGRSRPPDMAGSSPHTRGAPALDVQDRLTWRDHPRIRGEHLELGGGVVISGGSSPHTRGARTAFQESVIELRIIPAYAGSTRHGNSAPGGRADHPRIRGEHLDRQEPADRGQGSSPHTRGARLEGRSSWGRLGDHPRIRGEHSSAAGPGAGHGGSSPHTRGALV